MAAKSAQKATGLFLLGVCLANIIGAPLGGLLLSLDGMSGWHGWQWMFFIEGLPAIALAFVVWRRLPDKPADARWLDSDDVQAINAVLAKEAEETRHTPSRFSLKTALSTRVFLLLVLIYFTHQFSVYGLSYFLPGIIGSWGPAYSAAGWSADRHPVDCRRRGWGSCCRDSPARNSVPAAC